MSFYVAVALPDLAWVATDTRVVFPDGSRRDGGTKIATFAGGWITGGMIEGALRVVVPALGACQSPEEMRDVLVGERDMIDGVTARAPDGWRSLAAKACGFYVAEPGNLTRLDGPTFELQRLGTQGFVLPPPGRRTDELADLIATYHDQVRACFFDESVAIRWSAAIREMIGHTARLFAEAFKRFGHDGPMGPHVEMGIVRASERGLEWLHLPATPSSTPNLDALRSVAPGDVRYGWIEPAEVSAGSTDYGLQVFDQNAATVMDFTGAKRIFAVPVQPSVDSGASITLDLSTGLTQQVRLTSNNVTVRLANPVNGSRYRIWFQQDTVGSRPFPAVVLDSNGLEVVMYSNDTGTGPTPTRPSLTTEPGAFDLFEFEHRTVPTGRFTCMPLQTGVRLPCPLVLSITQTSFGAGGTTHNVNMPATVDAGDLLLMLFTRSGTSAVTTPTGWSLISSQGRLFVFAKNAVGNEDGTTVNVATAASENAAAQVYRITRWGRTVPTHVGASFGIETTNTFPDPPANAPAWSVDRTLWIAAFGSNGGTVVAYPANYTNGTDTISGAGDCTLSSARRALYATTENPGTFELLASQTWNAATITIRPAL